MKDNSSAGQIKLLSVLFTSLFFLTSSNLITAQLKIVSTTEAPEAIGPYSQAIKTGSFLFLSGQIPLDPATMQISGDNIELQTRQVFRNIKAVLKAGNLTLQNVVKCTVFMKNLDDFGKMNAIYGEEFGSHKPARSTVQAARIPKDVLIEIECIAAY
ncbi:MAG: RidA family protein [Melioribacteraceae bacterium]